MAGVDLGASGGRVVAAKVSADGVELHEVSRFPNEPVLAGGTLHWDILRLYADVLDGLRRASAAFPLSSAGIDSWGCDYGLLDESGALIGNPVHYRDRRTEGSPSRCRQASCTRSPGYSTCRSTRSTSSPPLRRPRRGQAARTLLMVPDLLGYWLTGEVGAEVTNASTTALLDVAERTWATGLMERAGIPPGLFPKLRQPGDVIGPVSAAFGGEAGGLATADGRPLPLVAVGSHDTASAVAAVPADGQDFAYISSGTWSLVGMELGRPVVTEASRTANFTNEAGLDGTVRYLRNVSGLWLLQECQRHWGKAAGPVEALLRAAAREPKLRFVIDADDPVFLPPDDMPGRIAAWLSKRGRPVPQSPAEFTRCVLDSLAIAYRRALADAQQLSGRHADVVHVVGGGSRNELLCQLTADATGLPVIAGPVEATALGNVLVQARALKAAPDSLAGLRSLLRSSPAVAGLRRYVPSGDHSAWAAAAPI